MVEPWATEIDLTSIDDANSKDPDRPVAISTKKMPTKQERCGIASLSIVQSPNCLRGQFAEYFDDTCPTGESHSSI